MAASAGLGAGAAFAIAPAAEAADFPVTNLNASGANSLADAINQANAAMGPDTITFDTSLSGTITTTLGLPTVTTPISIYGPQSGAVTVHSTAGYPSSTLSISGVTTDDPDIYDLNFSGSTNAIRVQDSNIDFDGVTVSNTAYGVRATGLTAQVNLDNANITATNYGIHANNIDEINTDFVTISGAGGEGIRQNGAGQIDLRDTIVQNNLGGGIRVTDELIMQRSTVTGNDGDRGAGIRLSGGTHQTARIDESTISGNDAQYAGGGIYATNHRLYIYGTTISGNTAPEGAGMSIGNHYLYVNGSTISGNIASTRGGALDDRLGDSYIDFEDSTIAGNTAPAGTGGGFRVPAAYGQVDWENVIIADNTGGDFVGNPLALRTGPQPDDPPTFNLIETPGPIAGLSASNAVGVDPQLGALGNNGGPTQTMLPGPSSPVLDQGNTDDDTSSSPVRGPRDQRNLTRPVDLAVANAAGGDGSDMGAVERQPNDSGGGPGPGPGGGGGGQGSSPAPPAKKKKKCKKKGKKRAAAAKKKKGCKKK